MVNKNAFQKMIAECGLGLQGQSVTKRVELGRFDSERSSPLLAERRTADAFGDCQSVTFALNPDVSWASRFAPPGTHPVHAEIHESYQQGTVVECGDARGIGSVRASEKRGCPAAPGFSAILARDVLDIRMEFGRWRTGPIGVGTVLIGREDADQGLARPTSDPGGDGHVPPIPRLK